MRVIAARLGAVCYAAWGLFHCKVAWDIALLGAVQHGIAQGRLYQLAAYMLTIALFVLVVGLWRNWRNDRMGYWLNLSVAAWADAIWVVVVVAPGYVPPVRGLVPPAIFVAAAILTTMARRRDGWGALDRRDARAGTMHEARNLDHDQNAAPRPG